MKAPSKFIKKETKRFLAKYESMLVSLLGKVYKEGYNDAVEKANTIGINMRTK